MIHYESQLTLQIHFYRSFLSWLVWQLQAASQQTAKNQFLRKLVLYVTKLVLYVIYEIDRRLVMFTFVLLLIKILPLIQFCLYKIFDYIKNFNYLEINHIWYTLKFGMYLDLLILRINLWLCVAIVKCCCYLNLAEAPLCIPDLTFSFIQGINCKWFERMVPDFKWGSEDNLWAGSKDLGIRKWRCLPTHCTFASCPYTHWAFFHTNQGIVPSMMQLHCVRFPKDFQILLCPCWSTCLCSCLTTFSG